MIIFVTLLSMRLFELKAIVKFLQQNHFLKTIHRVEDSLLKVEFDKTGVVFFSLKRGDGHIFKAPDFRGFKIYKAAFDLCLNQLNRCAIESFELLNEDKILRLILRQQRSYKIFKRVLQLEFTGKHTNAIVLDENEKIIEALRFVSEQHSSRFVLKGQFLTMPPPPPFIPKKGALEDVETFLKETYTQRLEKRLQEKKRQKIALLQKKYDLIATHLEKIKPAYLYEQEASFYSQSGTLVLANLKTIKPYDKILEAVDFEGRAVKIGLPNKVPPSKMADIFFKQAKKALAKARHSHIEKENLQSQKTFYEHFMARIKKARHITDIEALFFKQKSTKRDRKLTYEVFYYKGFKVLVGKNVRSNIEILENAKASDLWFHIKDYPSSHTLLITKKSNISHDIIEYTAGLCVDFSAKGAGNYEVHYTPRRNVRIQESSNVFYTEYKTIFMTTNN